MTIHDNPPKSTCSCNAYANEHQAGAIDFWGKREKAILKVLRQLHDKMAITPVQ